MKIAYVYDVIFPYVKGGAEKRFWELARRLTRRGHEVHLYGMKSWDGPADFIKEGVYLHGVCAHRALYAMGSGRRGFRQVIVFAMHILPALWKEQFDIIDCNAFPYLPFFPVRIYSLRRRVPLVITWQEVWDRYWYAYLGRGLGAIARLVEKMVMKFSPDVITYCETVKDDLIQRGYGSKRIAVIHQGVDLPEIEAARPGQEASDVIFVGRLIKDKNAELLVRAVHIMKKDFPRLSCCIVGDGPERAGLESIARELGLEKNIVFKGSLEHEQVIALMKASKILVFPSQREGFGVVVVEAMACGLPVITIRHPHNAATEFVRQGETGFICRINEQDIASTALLLLKNEGHRKHLAHQAQEFAQGFSWERIADESEQFYRGVMQRS